MKENLSLILTFLFALGQRVVATDSSGAARLGNIVGRGESEDGITYVFQDKGNDQAVLGAESLRAATAEDEGTVSEGDEGDEGGTDGDGDDSNENEDKLEKEFDDKVAAGEDPIQALGEVMQEAADS